MTPLSILYLRWQLWCECLFEPFWVAVKHVKPQEGAKPPYDFRPYWALINRIGRGPWWRIWRPWAESRTLGPVQMFDSVEHVLKVARLQAFEILYPEEAAEIQARERPAIPPPPAPKEHEYQIRLVDNGVVASCKCGWDGKHVGAVSGNDPECRFEFDRHVNEAEALARVGNGDYHQAAVEAVKKFDEAHRSWLGRHVSSGMEDKTL